MTGETYLGPEIGVLDGGTVRSVVFVELPTYENMLPLVSGYLQAYAQRDLEIRDSYQFEIISLPVTTERQLVLKQMVDRAADVYAISCYIWNMKLVKWLLRELTGRLPQAHIILGGPQVMNHAERYLEPDYRNVSVCNGEGERTFHELLRQLRSERPDLRQVPGLSFWDGAELVTTERAARIQNLMEIPSPFLNGVFKDQEYSFAIMETNRGCPFSCTFCYWGAATNDKVHKFEADRITAELDWISEHGFWGLFIADANWGLSPRDVELTEHIVRRSGETGYPLVVHMAAAKNKPERMAEITEIFVRGGLMVSQPISLQSLNPETLELVDRKNIRQETYIALQRTLREKQISSYVELIWPLPGETYDTFKRGITELCRSYADTLIVYPQLLLHNTPIFEQRARHGISTEQAPSEVAEAEVVVATDWVSPAECREGFWLYYAVHCLYNMRGLFLLSSYLDRTDVISFGDFFASAARYLQSRPDSDISLFFHRSVASLANYDLLNSGVTAHMVLSSHRDEFDRLLADFAVTQEWWSDPVAREMFELDLLARPYIYQERFKLPDYELSEVTISQGRDEYGITVSISQRAAELLEERELLAADQPSGLDRVTVNLDHRGRQKIPHMAERSMEHNANYCQGMVLRFREVLPAWTRVSSG